MGIKPIMCPKCPMGFARKINLSNHLRCVHTEAKYNCQKCEAKFKTNGSLTQHMLSVVTDEKPFKCSDCEKSFPTEGKKNCHLKDVHGKGDGIVFKKE